MAKSSKKKQVIDPTGNATAYAHDAKRKNNPPAGLTSEGKIPIQPQTEYLYSPRRPPALQFDPTGESDHITKDVADLLKLVQQRPLTPEEAEKLANAFLAQPWLEWAGKREQSRLAVDPVAIQIHEQIEAEAILRIATRQDVQPTLFDSPELSYTQAVEFYGHDVGWKNRLILGDSLQVMASLARREDLAGKVQMIYIDPPYGIKYPSNFQPEVGNRDVKDKESDLTREPEMVKAFRDTWHLGIHSYLSYLRDRLIVARALLADTGSVFVQISDENASRVRSLLDELFGAKCFVAEIAYVTTGGRSSKLLPSIYDRVIWYARSIDHVKYRQQYIKRELRDGGGWAHSRIERIDGIRENVGVERVKSMLANGERVRPYMMDQIISQGATSTGSDPFVFNGRRFRLPQNSHWKTNSEGMARLAAAMRIEASDNSIRYVRFFDDFSVQPVANVWSDTNRAGYLDEKRYVVQTSAEVVKRCILMTTDPGDLVLDPTCGSGTTAAVAEQWGRRWITIDTSRVAVAIARQRLLTAKFEYYQLRPVTPQELTEEPAKPWLVDRTETIKGPCTFTFNTVPHIKLGSIAKNQSLDPIFAKHEPLIAGALQACNAVLGKVPATLRGKLAAKLLAKVKAEGKKAVTDADRRRWLLPPDVRGTEEERQKRQAEATVDLESAEWFPWEIPFDTDPDWPADLRSAVEAYRKAWRAKMDAVNECIAKNAEQEKLVDDPVKDPKKVRVSGPFTVEGVLPPEITLSDVTQELPPIGGAPEKLRGTFAGAKRVRVVEPRNEFETANIGAYLDNMTAALKGDGVRFLGNKEMTFSSLRRCDSDPFHAEGRWVSKGEADTDPDGLPTVGVVFGPQYGPFTLNMLEPLIRPASRKYEVLIVAAFNFVAEVSEYAGKNPHPKLQVHLAHIRPDINPGMRGLLKQTSRSQLFTVFGAPRTRVQPVKGGEFRVHMDGVDIFDPVNNVLLPTSAGKVAAWFLDGDYDDKTFCITQAFFPDKSAWEKIAKALGGQVDAERFAALSGTVSLPFPAGKHNKCAVKVIDPRGNEVMRVHQLATEGDK